MSPNRQLQHHKTTHANIMCPTYDSTYCCCSSAGGNDPACMWKYVYDSVAGGALGVADGAGPGYGGGALDCGGCDGSGVAATAE